MMDNFDKRNKENCERRIQEILDKIEVIASKPDSPYPSELYDQLKGEFTNYGSIMWTHTADDRAAEKKRLDAEYDAEYAGWEAEWKAEDDAKAAAKAAAKNESRGAPMPKYILKQDVFMEHDGQMITIPEGTVLKEFVGTGAIGMGPGGSFNVSDHPKGGSVAMDKPEKTKVKSSKPKKKKKKVNESANNAREAAKMLEKDFLEWSGGKPPTDMMQIRKYYATGSSGINNKMFVFKVLNTLMKHTIANQNISPMPKEEVDEASNSQVSPLNQDY